MAEPLILDPNEPSGFRPAGGGGGGGGGGIEILDPIDVGSYDDVDPLDTRGARPSLGQRMSSMSIHRDRDRRESKSKTRQKRDSVISKSSDRYAFYRLEKDGDDWQYARKRKLTAAQPELEKQARKWKGSVLSESKAMGELRTQQLQRLIDDANAEEDGDGTWDVAWLESQKVRNGDRIECRRMDVILARSKKFKSRSKSSGGEIIDVFESSKHKDKDKDKRKDKDKDRNDSDKEHKEHKEHKRRDSVLEDPFQQSVLFHRTGKPMDDRGPIEFSNAGLPPEIPRDRPIGARTDKEKRGKDRRRRKSEDHGGGDDEIVRVDEVLADGPGDSIAAILRGEHRSRAGSRGGEPFEPIEVEAGRSRSRRRLSGAGRSRSRPRSQSRPESIRFPPSYYTRGYIGDGGSDAVSSVSSGESRYGLDREERSSYTSQDTFHDMTGRGTHYNDGRGYHDDKHGEKVYYKEHHRGPSMSRSRGPSVSRGGTPKYYQGDVYEMPAHSGGRDRRRSSRAYESHRFQERIPEERQIEYFDHPRESGTLVRRATYDPAYDRDRDRERDRGLDRRDSGLRSRDVKLHYPSDMVDLKARERYAEDYQRESVKGEYMDRQERDIRRREDRMDDLEEERRWREQVGGGRRYSRYDDPYGGGYHH